MPSEQIFTDLELVSKVEEYFFSENLTSLLEDFAQANAKSFEASLAEGEYVLCLFLANRNCTCSQICVHSRRALHSYVGLHEQFKALIEQELVDFIEQELKSTPASFFAAIKRQLEEGVSTSDASLFMEIFSATTDFDVFIQMMRETAIQQANDCAQTREGKSKK